MSLKEKDQYTQKMGKKVRKSAVPKARVIDKSNSDAAVLKKKAASKTGKGRYINPPSSSLFVTKHEALA